MYVHDGGAEREMCWGVEQLSRLAWFYVVRIGVFAWFFRAVLSKRFGAERSVRCGAWCSCLGALWMFMS